MLGNQRGVALIVVLWIFIFLFVVAFDFSASVREEAAATHRFSDETQGYYLAVAGFERGLYDFIHQARGGNPQADPAKSDLFDGSWREEQLGSGGFRVRLVDEGGKINLNRVNEAVLRRVFTNLGVDSSVVDILVDSIMDWRDPDDLHRTNGAESDYYGLLSPAYTAKNGPLDSVEDLLWIRGMTPALYLWLCRRQRCTVGALAAGRIARYLHHRQPHRPGQPAHRDGAGDSRYDRYSDGEMPQLRRGTQKFVG